jgi:hypothetical protein
MERQENQPWAVPSAHFCRYKLTGDEQAFAELNAIAEHEFDECGIEAMFASMLGGYSGDDSIQRARALLAQLQSEQK